MNKIKGMMLGGAMGMAIAGAALAQEETIKVGVLHSLSGTMAISETTLKDTMLMLIAEQNAKGGLLGKQLEAVVVDPASDWPLFAEKARELLTVSNVDVMFGCWTSVSRKSVLPVIEELNGLLFYPVQYEGEESSKNVFYTGAAPNQQAIPATDYFLEELGVEKFALLGTDYVYPRTTNNILESYLVSKGHRQGRHLRELHAVRPFRLVQDRGRCRGAGRGWQEGWRDFHHQRRRQYRILQGTGGGGRLGGRNPRRGLFGRRGGTVGS